MKPISPGSRFTDTTFQNVLFSYDLNEGSWVYQNPTLQIYFVY